MVKMNREQLENLIRRIIREESEKNVGEPIEQPVKTDVGQKDNSRNAKDIPTRKGEDTPDSDDRKGLVVEEHKIQHIVSKTTEDIDYICPNCKHTSQTKFDVCPNCNSEITWQ